MYLEVEWDNLNNRAICLDNQDRPLEGYSIKIRASNSRAVNLAEAEWTQVVSVDRHPHSLDNNLKISPEVVYSLTLCNSPRTKVSDNNKLKAWVQIWHQDSDNNNLSKTRLVYNNHLKEFSTSSKLSRTVHLEIKETQGLQIPCKLNHHLVEFSSSKIHLINSKIRLLDFKALINQHPKQQGLLDRLDNLPTLDKEPQCKWQVNKISQEVSSRTLVVLLDSMEVKLSQWVVNQDS